jgi:hypothetical protein
LIRKFWLVEKFNFLLVQIFIFLGFAMSESPEGSTVDLTVERTSSTSTDATPTPKRNLSSPVHQHFILNNETQKMQCKHCRWVSEQFLILGDQI